MFTDCARAFECRSFSLAALNSFGHSVDGRGVFRPSVQIATLVDLVLLRTHPQNHMFFGFDRALGSNGAARPEVDAARFASNRQGVLIP